MARKPRIEFPGAIYHIITRGNNRQKTFADDEDYKLLGKKPSTAVKSLQKYVNDGLTGGHNESYYKLRDQRILGEAEFANEIIKTNEARVDDFEYYNMSIDDAVALVAKHADIGVERIKTITRGRLGSKARGMVAYICKVFGGKRSVEVAKYFGRSDVIMSKLIRQIEFEKDGDEEFKRLMKKIELEIKGSYRPLLVREIKVK